MDGDGLGIRHNQLSGTSPPQPTEWPHNTQSFARKPLSPTRTPLSPTRTPTTPVPAGSPHRRSPSTPGTIQSQKSFAERAGYFPPPIAPGPLPTTAERPKPAPLQFDTFEYSPSSTFSTPRFATLRDAKHRKVDSGSALLTPAMMTPMGGDMGPPGGYVPYQYPPHQYPPHPYHYATQYNLIQKYWHSSWNMYFLLLVGICFALGHHFFYASLNGQDTSNQVRMLRYGATLSFLSKASLAAAVILAFRQRVWMTVRRKVMSLGGVDSLFAAAEDLSAVFNWEVFRHARIAMLLAVYVWCTPLVVILTSETLAVEPMTKIEETKCPSVRTLNFSHEETNDWRTGQKINNLWELSVSYWNTTSMDTNDPNFFDYFTGTSRQFEEIAILSAFLKRPITRTGAAEEACGVGWNCTFTVNFTGPGYRCTELASGVGSVPRALGKATAPFNTSILAPTGNFTYFVKAFEGDYNPIQTDSGDAGIPNYPPPFPKNLGALRTEPVLWFGYSAVDDPSQPQPDNSSDPRWHTAFTPKIFGCEHWETEYTVQFNYTGLTQRTAILRREHLRPIIDTTYIPGQLANDGTLDNVTAVPESNYVFPQDVQRYRRTAAYHSIGLQLRNFINGTIQEPGKIVKTHAIQTKLIDVHSYLGVPDLMEAVQDFYSDMLLSMFSNPQFLAVSWASDPGRVTGTRVGGADTLYPCKRERTDNRYRYHVLDLWAVYIIAIVLACMGVGFGSLAISEEGVVRDTRFSSIVAATRGPGLEKVPFAGEVPVREDVRRIRVGYGFVPRGYGVATQDGGYAFGLEGNVRQEDSLGGAATPAQTASKRFRSPRFGRLGRRWFGSPKQRWERLNG